MADKTAEPELPQSLWPLCIPSPAAIVDESTDSKLCVPRWLDAAGVGLWFSYIFVLLYLLIAAGSFTHRDLFLENPVKLPFLNVDLPLVGFFVFGCLLLQIVHAYVLVHFVLLVITLVNTELEAQIPNPDVQAQLRHHLPSNILLQILAGPPEVRDGIIGVMRFGIAGISLAVGPLALLVFFQIQGLDSVTRTNVEVLPNVEK